MTTLTRPDLASFTEGRQNREYQCRAALDTEKREVEGVSVPWGQVADLGWGVTESVQRGAVDDDGALIFYAHREAIGKLISSEDQDGGRFIRARISETTLGNDALTLARDGVVANWSIGFEPVEYTTEEREDGTVHITHTQIRVREISLVPLPAYEGAKVTNVRQGVKTRGNTTMADTAVETPQPPAVDGLELRAAIDDLERRFAGFSLVVKEEPVLDTRSVGQALKAIVAGDQATIDTYEAFAGAEIEKRAYTGGTTADAVMKPSWVGDLTRIVDEAAPLLDVFAKGDLPETGNTIEYAQLKSNTVTVTKQEAEGDNLTYGKVAIETKNAPVETFGGYGELSFQTVQRSSIGILNTLLLAQGIAAGKAMNTKMRAVFLANRAAQVTAANTVAVPATGAAYTDWVNAIVDAAIKFDALGLPITNMVTNAMVFKALGALTAEDGRPVLLVSGAGNNNVGTFNPVGLSADLAGVTVRLDAGLANTNPLADFVNKNAIRSYIDPVSRLTDENIINLTKQYSVYRYAAFATEIPAAQVPVAFSA